jgi:ribosomal protein L1
MGQQKQVIISGEPEKTDKVEQSEISTEVGEKVKKEKIIPKVDKTEKIKNAKKVRSKNYQKIKDLIIKSNPNSTEKAVELLKNSVKPSKNNSFELHIALNLKPKPDIQLKIKPDKNLVIHSKIGKFSDKIGDISKNINALIENVLQTKPTGKKNFIKSVSICTTQSPSVKIKVEE